MNQDLDKNSQYFAPKNANTKYAIKSIIKNLSKSVNEKKINYDQLRYIFKSVRSQCELESPARTKALFELPTESEIEKFFRVIKNPVHKLIFEFLDGSGLRVSELCHLEVRRIDFTNNTIFVKDGKGKKDRVTLIGNHLLEKIALYLANRNNRYLFESNRNKRFSTRRIEQICSQYKTLAKITHHLSPHTFRHRWNTRLAEGGISREGREILAGHSKGSAVQDVYTHLGVGGIKEKVIAILDR